MSGARGGRAIVRAISAAVVAAQAAPVLKSGRRDGRALRSVGLRLQVALSDAGVSDARAEVVAAGLVAGFSARVEA